MSDNPFGLENERAVGDFGLSMATDLAIAGSVGRHPDNPLNKQPILEYGALWVNVGTLVRNALNAYPTERQKELVPEDLLAASLEDMQALTSFYDQVLPPEYTLEIVFYHNDYSLLERKMTKALPRPIRTKLQTFFHGIQEKAIESLLQEAPYDVRKFRFDIRGEQKHVAILTHQPIDLLNHRSFYSLGLLESHTGVIKGRELWYTKFGRGDDLKPIPFDRAMVQIFGDGNNLLKMYPQKIRRKVLEIAVKRRWSYLTSKEKVIADLKTTKEIELVMLVNDLYR